LESLLPIGILLILGLGMCVGIFLLTTFLGPRNPTAIKNTPYECGIKTDQGGPRVPFKNRFYLIAVLFLLFDVEAAFFFPWALVFRESLAQNGMLLVAGGVYLAFMILALAYIYSKNALELK